LLNVVYNFVVYAVEYGAYMGRKFVTKEATRVDVNFRSRYQRHCKYKFHLSFMRVPEAPKIFCTGSPKIFKTATEDVLFNGTSMETRVIF